MCFDKYSLYYKTTLLGKLFRGEYKIVHTDNIICNEQNIGRNILPRESHWLRSAQSREEAREVWREEGVPWGWMKRGGEGEAAGVGARVGFDQYLAPTPYHHTTILRSGTPCPH